MNKIIRNLVGTIMTLWLFTGTVSAATEIHWWHAFKGRLGTLLAEQVDQFNAAQSEYIVVQNRKGNYSETLNAGIAAFRAKKASTYFNGFRGRNSNNDGC